MPLPSSLTDRDLEKLIDAAQDAARRSYCPYSRFPVGAALLTDLGGIYSGCNVENASYGLTICAERNALFQAVAAGHRRFRALVIFTPTPQPTPPCGACCQALCEFVPTLPIVSVCHTEARIETSLDRLLPAAFVPASIHTEESSDDV